MAISPLIPNASPPSRLQDRYRLSEWLGQGNMGVVYRANDELLRRDVAIKFLAPDLVRSEEASARFLREAQAIARLSHANIMALYDVGRQDGWHYLVLEYIDGQDLHEVLVAQQRPLPLQQALTIGRGILQALAYAHQQGTIHRDIKPENVMLTADQQVKVTDFGLARVQGDVRLTQEGSIVGTALYLAPELITGEEADERSDLYAFGAVLYELLTARPPFVGDTPVAVLTHILNTPVTPPRQIMPDIPLELDDLIVRLLDKDRNGRYSSAQSVLDALPQTISQPTSKLATHPTPSATNTLVERIVRASTDELPATNNQLLLFAALEDTAVAVENERRRLAQQLQQEIIEPLTLLLTQASTYEQVMAANPMGKTAVSVLTTLARQVIQQARDLESTLAPTLLDTLGLEPALQGLVDQMMRVHGLQIALSVPRMKDRLPAPIELALFRLTQDALTRAVRQTRATQATIELTAVGNQCHYHFQDNGLHPAEANLPILGRIEQLGGTITLATEKQSGLDLTVHLVLSATPEELTPRELEVLSLLSDGLSNKEIAQRLDVTPRTVNFHLDNLYSKLGVNSRTEAVVYALRRGLFK